VDLTRARELALLGNEIDGKTAAAIGLIYKSVKAFLASRTEKES
jgi:enoyl-CoA hydratase/carnithine racemase